jgi:hypothetical protein
MLRFILPVVCLILFLGGTNAFAQDAPDIYPVLDGGVVKVRVEAAPEDPGMTGTASLGVVQMNGSAGETLLVCAPDAGNGVTASFDSVVAENPGGGEMAIIKGRAYPAPGCTGDLSADSANTAYVRFVGPAAPSLVEPDGTPPDITIP